MENLRETQSYADQTANSQEEKQKQVKIYIWRPAKYRITIPLTGESGKTKYAGHIALETYKGDSFGTKDDRKESERQGIYMSFCPDENVTRHNFFKRFNGKLNNFQTDCEYRKPDHTVTLSQLDVDAIHDTFKELFVNKIKTDIKWMLLGSSLLPIDENCCSIVSYCLIKGGIRKLLSENIIHRSLISSLLNPILYLTLEEIFTYSPRYWSKYSKQPLITLPRRLLRTMLHPYAFLMLSAPSLLAAFITKKFNLDQATAAKYSTSLALLVTPFVNILQYANYFELDFNLIGIPLIYMFIKRLSKMSNINNLLLTAYIAPILSKYVDYKLHNNRIFFANITMLVNTILLPCSYLFTSFTSSMADKAMDSSWIATTPNDVELMVNKAKLMEEKLLKPQANNKDVHYPRLNDRDKAATKIQAAFRGFFIRKESPLSQLSEQRQQEIKEKSPEAISKLKEGGKYQEAVTLETAIRDQQWHKAMQIMRSIAEKEIEMDCNLKIKY